MNRRILEVSFAILGIVVAFSAGFAGMGQGLEQQLQLWREQVQERPASGNIALVEIDARSLKAYPQWPWPRSIYGDAIRELERNGAREVAFDIDFSSLSTSAEDQALAQAIEESSIPIILPTFRQAASYNGEGLVENLPFAYAAENAILASVNIVPDADGFVRSSLYGVETGGVPRPSLAAMLASENGKINQQFPIDGSITANSIPRISFVDLLEHRVDAKEITGRSFLIGATAVEMGDRYALPGKGVLPGALIQLLAAETLIQGTAPFDHGFLLPIGLLAILAVLIVRRRKLTLYPYAILLTVMLAAPMAMQWLKLGTISVVPALLGQFVMLLGLFGGRVFESVYDARFINQETGLQNQRVLRKELAETPDCVAVVVQVANFSDVLNVLGRERTGQFLIRVSERLAAMTSGTIYRMNFNTLGWTIRSMTEVEYANQIEAGIVLFNQPIEIDGRSIKVVPSFGTSGAANDGSHSLDLALQAAGRATERNVRWERHEVEHGQESDWRLALASELDTAMVSGAIWVAFQPKFDTRLRKITSVEALARWSHPERGAINPESLISVVERSGHISDFTCHVLHRALECRQQWLDCGLDLASR